MLQPFSVAMCVYGGDNPQWFDRSLESIILEQTIKPNEIILVVDGPVPAEVDDVINKYCAIGQEHEVSIVIERFKENQGHGNARRKSVDLCSNELVALMDADDVSVPTRFEEQLQLFDKRDSDIVGGNISEFINEESNIVSRRNVPALDFDIKKYAKKRCPMNQVTVMFKKTAYIDAGGYIDWFWEEDYYLWLRMILKNKTFSNTQTVLVNVRVGEDMYKRRGGIKYYKSEKRIQRFMLKNKMISFPRYISNCFKRFVVQVLMPSKVRGWAFRKFARS